MKFRLSSVALASAIALISVGNVMATTPTFLTIVKLTGIGWFDRMETGVKKYAADTGTNASQSGPSKGDVQLQIQLIEDAIAKKPQGLAVVPLSPEAVEPALKKAQDAGIKVVTHEASTIQNASYNIEAFTNADYGIHLMDQIAKCMGENGQYAVFVGSLTSKSHNEWVDAAVEHQKKTYPNMELVGSKNESNDDQQTAYNKALELLRTYPELKGFQGSSSLDVPGIALAVEERGLEDKTCVIGTSLPSMASDYLESGAADMITFWDPADAGYLMNKVLQMVIDGRSISDGDDLGIEGYNNVKVDGKVIYGRAWVSVTNENKGDYPF